MESDRRPLPPPLDLYIWEDTDFLRDYSGGTIFAMAPSVEAARYIVLMAWDARPTLSVSAPT